MNSEAVAVTERVVRALETLQIPYLIGGSMASTAYGRIRATMDVDIVADLSIEQVDPLVALLGDEFYADAEMMRQAIDHRSSFNLIHLTTMFKVDIFVIKDRPYDRQQLERRLARSLEPSEQIVYVASPEDVILAKLEWYRLGGEVSERQWRDIQGVLDVQGNRLDRDYMRHWAAILDVADLLVAALDEYEARQQISG
jgi:hypothetical protein